MVKSYYYRKPYRIKKKKIFLRRKGFWFLFFGFSLLISIFYFLFFSPFFEVKQITISGNEKIKTEEIKGLIENNIWSDFKLFKNKNINLIKKNKINDIFLKEFPQIKNFSFKKRLPNTLEITIKERQPIAIFKKEHDCFFIDSEGIIFEKVSDCNRDFFVIQNFLLNQDLVLGNQAVSKEDISKISQIESYFKEEIKIPLKEFSIVSDERLNVKTDEEWEAYFSLSENIQWQLVKLKILLEKKIPPEKRKNVKYIDLRFERVYIFPETYNQ